LRDDQIVCRCEEITYGEIRDAIRHGARDVDAVKRMTRAGMGLCQGRTCGRIVARIVAQETGVPVSEVRLVTQRLPVRPVPARVLADARLPSQRE
jgi:NAD(P)H-nitrite reductase large subunit